MGSIWYSYNEGGALDFDAWVSLWTLCLFPLIAHIYAGAPKLACLDDQRGLDRTTRSSEHKEPQWYDRAILLNPTSILWRYFAVLDRRVRAKNWNATALAATNTAFWHEGRWVGSEEMISKSAKYCIIPPRSGHAKVFSVSTVKTLVVTLQGVQALFEMSFIFHFADRLSLAKAFTPLALFGLLRLPAALWLANDFEYEDLRHVEDETGSSLHRGGASSFSFDGKVQSAFSYTPTSTSSQDQVPIFSYPLARKDTHERSSLWYPPLRKGNYVQLSEVSPLPPFESHPPSHWRGILVRMSFILLYTAMVGLPVSYFAISGLSHGFDFVATAFVMLLFYTVFTVGNAFLFIKASWDEWAAGEENGRHTSTVIPGMHTVWYKLYTALLFLLAAASCGMAALETRKLPCGEYSLVNNAHFVCTGFTFVPEMDLTFESVTKGGKRINGSVTLQRGAFIGGDYRGMTNVYTEDGQLNRTISWPGEGCGSWLDCEPDEVG